MPSSLIIIPFKSLKFAPCSWYKSSIISIHSWNKYRRQNTKPASLERDKKDIMMSTTCCRFVNWVHGLARNIVWQIPFSWGSDRLVHSHQYSNTRADDLGAWPFCPEEVHWQDLQFLQYKHYGQGNLKLTTWSLKERFISKKNCISSNQDLPRLGKRMKCWNVVCGSSSYGISSLFWKLVTWFK